MKGRPTLWLPGTDHAGIATQVPSTSKTLLLFSTTLYFRVDLILLAIHPLYVLVSSNFDEKSYFHEPF